MPTDYHYEDKCPNQEPRTGPVTGIVIHSTRGGTANNDLEWQATRNWFLSPDSQTSAHLVIGANGDYGYFVAPDRKAYHAEQYNDSTIGIELVQRGPMIPFTDIQYKRLKEALDYYCALYKIPYQRGLPGIIGHEAIDPQKSDPGFLFDWARLGLATTPPSPVDWPLVDQLREARERIGVLEAEKAALVAWQDKVRGVVNA